MCGRYILVEKAEVLESRFQALIPDGFQFPPSFNISPGQYAPVIVGVQPRRLVLMRFGLTPFWAKKDLLLINARSEGDHNPTDDPKFTGTKGIIIKPAFRKPIRSQRCLIPADAFIEGTTKEKLSKPFLIYLRNKVRPFAMAGIYDEWLNNDTQQIVRGFSIVTTTPNELMQKIPHHRMPVILHPGEEALWLNPETPLYKVTNALNPFPSEAMNGYPISSEVKSPKVDHSGLIKPVGELLEVESEFRDKRSIYRQGMGNAKEKFDDHNPYQPL